MGQRSKMKLSKVKNKDSQKLWMNLPKGQERIYQWNHLKIKNIDTRRPNQKFKNDIKNENTQGQEQG